jgi:hypothetical protein
MEQQSLPASHEAVLPRQVPPSGAQTPPEHVRPEQHAPAEPPHGCVDPWQQHALELTPQLSMQLAVQLPSGTQHVPAGVHSPAPHPGQPIVWPQLFVKVPPQAYVVPQALLSGVQHVSFGMQTSPGVTQPPPLPQ